jgi:hypothetical protein
MTASVMMNICRVVNKLPRRKQRVSKYVTFSTRLIYEVIIALRGFAAANICAVVLNLILRRTILMAAIIL